MMYLAADTSVFLLSILQFVSLAKEQMNRKKRERTVKVVMYIYASDCLSVCLSVCAIFVHQLIQQFQSEEGQTLHEGVLGYVDPSNRSRTFL